jgi:hypothetical protein
MNFLIITFILGVVNVFIAGANLGTVYVRSKIGGKVDYKDYIATVLPVTVGVYLLVDILFKVTK